MAKSQLVPLPEGLGAPANRALAGAGIHALEELAAWMEEDVARLHGIGPKALRILKTAMEAKGLSFAR